MKPSFYEATSESPIFSDSSDRELGRAICEEGQPSDNVARGVNHPLPKADDEKTFGLNAVIPYHAFFILSVSLIANKKV